MHRPIYCPIKGASVSTRFSPSYKIITSASILGSSNALTGVSREGALGVRCAMRGTGNISCNAVSAMSTSARSVVAIASERKGLRVDTASVSNQEPPFIKPEFLGLDGPYLEITTYTPSGQCFVSFPSFQLFE
jgi:hypothetical protein